MIKIKEILFKRFDKLKNHYLTIKEYKLLIDNLLTAKNIYDVSEFNRLSPQEKAVLDAYLKRFSSIQDFLGAKIFPLLTELLGIETVKMSEILSQMEREQVIDSMENWVELREARNELEHDYPDDLKEALESLRFCINSFETLEKYYFNSVAFAKRYINET